MPWVAAMQQRLPGYHPVQVLTHSGLVHAAGRLAHRPGGVQALLFENR
jgi:hypothetical protein